MTWAPLGSITPAQVWQSLPEPTQSTLFKIRQNWNNQFPGVGSIKFAYDFDGLIYENQFFIEVATEIIQVIHLSAPKTLLAMPFNSRRLALRFSEGTRIHANLPWSIEVEEWTGPEIADNVIDGGVY